MKKKILCGLLAIGLVACGGEEKSSSNTPTMPGTASITDAGMLDAYIADNDSAAMAVVNAMQADTAFMDTMEAMMPTIAQSMGQSISGPEMDKFMKAMKTVMKDEMPAFKQDMADVYDKNFSKDELRDLVAFYLSDTGKKLGQKTGVLASEGAVVGQNLMIRVMPRIESEMR